MVETEQVPTLEHVALVSEDSGIAMAELTQVATAFQEQESRHFAPIWDISADVKAFDKLRSVPVSYWPM